MYEGVPSLVWWSWLTAAVVLAVMAGHRLWLFTSGRRDRVNRFVTAAVLAATAFVATRYPSPARYGLDLIAPRWALFLNYSLVIWGLYSVFVIGCEVYRFPRWHARAGFAFAAAIQVGTAVAFWHARLEEPFSLSAEARAGDLGAFLYLAQMIVYCAAGALYLAILLLKLARKTTDAGTALGQRTVAVGLLILTAAALEEGTFLLSSFIPMRIHGVTISSLVMLGALFLSGGIFLFSPLGRRLVESLSDTILYARLRPLGRQIARTWPEVCGGERFAWWTCLDLPQVFSRLYSIVLHWQDLRRLLVVYVPDAELPVGTDPDPAAEAAYLSRGLRRESLKERENEGDPGSLRPVPQDVREAGPFLLKVKGEM